MASAVRWCCFAPIAFLLPIVSRAASPCWLGCSSCRALFSWCRVWSFAASAMAVLVLLVWLARAQASQAARPLAGVAPLVRGVPLVLCGGVAVVRVAGAGGWGMASGVLSRGGGLAALAAPRPPDKTIIPRPPAPHNGGRRNSLRPATTPQYPRVDHLYFFKEGVGVYCNFGGCVRGKGGGIHLASENL